MNNLERDNPGPDGAQKPFDSPRGFIDPTYRAAGKGNRANQLVTEGSNQGRAHVTSAVGGSVSTLSFEEAAGKIVSSRKDRRGGGIRGRINGLSRTSRRNLQRRFATINRVAFREFKGRVYFVTVTCPGEGSSEDPAACKMHLKALRKRLERKFGEFAGFWRMGIQQRGALHFHLILFVLPSFATLSELRRSVAHAWYEICGEVSEEHLCAGTNVEAVRKWKQMTSRAEKYTARKEEFPEGLQTGRVWGVWNEGFLPVQWETVEVGLRDAYKIRRVYRKLARRRRGGGRLHRTTVFVRHENVVRLLEFLGYRFE